MFLTLTMLFLVISLLVSNVLAGIYVINPQQGSTCTGGQPCTVDWLEDGQSPLLSAIGLTSVGLYTGDQQLVQTIAPVDVSRVHSLTFTPIREAGPSSDTYYVSFIAMNLLRNDSLPYAAFSPFFRLDGMRGSFSNPLSSAISPIPVPTTTATLPPITGDPLITITVGTLSTASRSTSSSSVSSASITPSTLVVVSTSLTTVSSQTDNSISTSTPTSTSTSTPISDTSVVTASASAVPSGFTTSVVSNTGLLPSTSLVVPNGASFSPSITPNPRPSTTVDPQANTNDALSTVMALNSRNVGMMGFSVIVMLLVLGL